MSETLANACFEVLHNPYNKRKITISSSSLLKYLKQFSLENHKETYVCILVNYIRALNYSMTLPDYVRYGIFSRFAKHILIINTFLRFAETENVIHIEPEDDSIERLKINKYVSNRIQKFKGMSIPDEYIIALKEVQKNMNWLSKNVSDTNSLSKKKLFKCCSDIHSGLIFLSELGNIGYYDEYCNILNTYRKLKIEYDGKQKSVVALLAQILEYDNTEKIMAHAKYIKDNIYIKLLLSNILTKDLDHVRVSDLYTDICNNIYDYINSIVDVDSFKAYDKVIQFVALDEFKFPILTVAEDSSSYNIAMLYILASI